MMRLAGATFSFGDLTLEESAGVLRQLGFSRADVGAGWSNYHQVLPQQAVDDPAGQADRVRRAMGEHGLEVSELFVMHFGKPVNHPDPEAPGRAGRSPGSPPSRGWPASRASC